MKSQQRDLPPVLPPLLMVLLTSECPAVSSKEEKAAGANGVRLVKTVVANDAVAVIVNESNPLSKLSLKDVERIFTGDVTNWSAVVERAEVSPVIPVTHPPVPMHSSRSLLWLVLTMVLPHRRWLVTSKSLPVTTIQMALVMLDWPMSELRASR